jgi:hypothetical protein
MIRAYGRWLEALTISIGTIVADVSESPFRRCGSDGFAGYEFLLLMAM